MQKKEVLNMQTNQNKPYQLITDRIVEKLEEGTIPWHKPWADAGLPKNLISKNNYRGINVFLLSCLGYESPFWLTFNQAKKLGGSIRKGEKACPVVFWKSYPKKIQTTDEETGEECEKTRKYFVLRHYFAFNSSQCSGIDAKVPLIEPKKQSFSAIATAEEIAQNMPNPPKIKHEKTRAFYCPPEDFVNMPRPELFDSSEEYYNTLYHELTHSTGHHDRLCRKAVMQTSYFGSNDYSKEELVAEMGAAFLSGHAGIETATIDNSAAYIQGWLSKLRNDPQLVVQAAASAQKAADYILQTKENLSSK